MNHNQASILGPGEVAEGLQTNISTGLTAFEARDRVKRYGSNTLADTTDKSMPKLLYRQILAYLNQFMNPLIQLLIICSLISLIMGEYNDAISVAASLLIVNTISYIQEYRCDKSLEKLNKQVPNICKVLRDSKTFEINSEDLVPGDIIYLNEGQRVPADMRLFQVSSMTIDESNLTGETKSQLKNEEHTLNRVSSILDGQASVDEDKNIIYRNLAMMGTLVESGHAKGIVICTGKSTRYGQVYSMLKSTKQPKSPLQANIDQLSMHLVVSACSTIALVSIVGIIQQRSIEDVAFYAISLVVTAIPEGLPVALAVIMALSILRLGRHKAIIKSLNSVETLGCVQILCADKTGTLTRSEMTLTDIVTSELHSLSTSDIDELNNEEFKKHMTFNMFGGKLHSIGLLMEVGTLCNNASYDSSAPDGSGCKFLGQATECAILDASMRLGFNDSRGKFERLGETPFDRVTKRMVVQCLRRDTTGNNPVYYVKGAWEGILNDCVNYSENGMIKPRTKEMWQDYSNMCSALCAQGLRVLGFALGPSLDQLTFVGVVGINNAPRDGAIEAIQRLKKEFKIDVKMITGDSEATAMSVAKNLGILDLHINESGASEYESDGVMSGDQVQKILNSEMDDHDKAQAILSKSVFYRVDPIQKAGIVSKLQELDKIVAMTGDGINDVISLKQSNLSIVMSSGADVCKELADVILLDNNLSVLVEAIIEGKGVYKKIQSFLVFQLSMSLSLIFLTGLSYLTQWDAPYTVSALLFLNILVDGPPAQALAFERTSLRDLDMKPRDVFEPLLNWHLLGNVVALTSTVTLLNVIIYVALTEDGKLDTYGRAIMFSCFIFCSLFSALSLRGKVKITLEMKVLGNKELFWVCATTMLVLVAILNVKLLSNLFQVEPISFLELAYLLMYTSLVLVTMDMIKILIRALKYYKILPKRK